MISKEKRILIDVLAVLSFWFFTLLTVWLIWVFGFSIWFTPIPFISGLISFFTISLNEPAYLEYAESISSKTVSGKVKE